jgi:predicted homoserine dehydrogenase-like protein
MGNTQARMSRRSPSTRKETIKAVANVTAQKVNKAQEQILTQFKNDKTALITPSSVAMALSVCETAKTQIQREGAVLTKADLIAIIVALNGSNDIAALQSLTIGELNTMIRGIVYDPSRYMKIGGNSTSSNVLSLTN